MRKLPEQCHKYLIQIFEFCINHQYFPPEWKHGIIVTIPKPNTDHHIINNYRPITLLSVLGKLFEQIIKSLLQKEIGHKIPNYQFGFKEKNSTIHPVTILTSNVQANKLIGNHNAALFLDISKAFDSIWHKGLLFKLKKLGCPKYLTLLLRGYLMGRSMQIRVNNYTSSIFYSEQGVPQGSPLATLLSKVYCYDIFSEDIMHFNSKIYILQFADDTALISHNNTLQKTVDELQQLVDKTMVWFNIWRLKINPDKSQYVIFNHKITMNSPNLTMGNNVVIPQDCARYLGVNIDHKLTFKQHASIIKKKCIARSKHFRSLTYKNSGITTKTAAHIYKTICRPLLEYCHPIYLSSNSTTKKLLQTAETTSLRAITKMRHPRNELYNPPNNLLYEKTQIKPISDRLDYLSTKFSQREDNIKILREFCINRNQELRPHRKTPLNTIWEVLQNKTS